MDALTISAAEASVALSIRNLSHGFIAPDGRIRPVLDGLTLEIAAGEMVSIVGRSGAGKTTLFNLISGLISPADGRIEIGAQREGGEREDGAGFVAYMLQKDLLLPWRTVLQNALLGIELRGAVTARHRANATAMLERYGLGAHLDAYPAALSGGQRQRVALTRTLLIEPSILLLDEPFSALDYETRLMLEDDVMALRSDRGINVILVTHDIEEAIAMGDRVVVLGGRPGRIVEDIPIRLTTHGRRDPANAREAPEFRAYHRRLWAALKGTAEAPETTKTPETAKMSETTVPEI